MSKPGDLRSDWESKRKKIIGLGERSVQKSYYPELQRRLAEMERFRALLDQANDAIFLLHVPSGNVVDANQSACDQLGYKSAVLQDLPISKLIPRPAWGQIETLFGDEQAVGGGGEMIRTRLYRKDEGSFPVEMTMRLVAFDEVVYAIVVARDITERRLAEQELESRRKLWDAVMESTPELVYFKDAQHRIIRASQAYADIYGLEPEELIGKSAADLWPEEAEEILADERNVLQGNPVIDKERKVTGPEGETRWYSLTKVPIYEAGEIVGFFAIDKEITDRMQAEQALRKSESRYRNLFNIVPVGIYRTTPEGRILDGNPAMRQILGFPDQETMLASNIRNLFVDEVDRQEELSLLAGCRRDTNFHNINRPTEQKSG